MVWQTIWLSLDIRRKLDLKARTQREIISFFSDGVSFRMNKVARAE
jgi:hypothetical protein